MECSMAKNNISYWEKSYWYEPQNYIIVGAGIVGLSTAIFLRQKFPNSKISVIERGVVPDGASTRNAGFACFGTVGEISDDLTRMEESELIDTIRMRWNGLKRLMHLTAGYDISYIETGGDEIFLSEQEYSQCYSQLSVANHIIGSAIGESEVIRSIDSNIFSSYRYSLHNRLEGQLNPVKMIKALEDKARRTGIDIHYGVELEAYEYSNSMYAITTNHGYQIQTHNIVLCTNAFTDVLSEVEDLIPMRNQVIVTHPIKDMNIKGTFHYDRGYIYFRNVGTDRILIGGARNIDSKTEQTTLQAPNDLIINHLTSFVETHVIGKPIKIDQQWSGIIATGESKKPMIRKLSDGLYIGIRLGGMGVAIGAMVGEELSELIYRDSY